MTRERILVMVEIALTVALAFVLNFFKLWRMPQGGSVALDMLPILVLSIRRGTLPGLTAGVLFGLLNFIVEPVFVHPAQVLLDYPLAFGVLGLAGLFRRPWLNASAARHLLTGWALAFSAVLLGSLLRYAAHVASGVVFFAEYAPAGQPVLAYSLLYNSYVLVSAAGCLALAVLILPALERVVPSRLPEGPAS